MYTLYVYMKCVCSNSMVCCFYHVCMLMTLKLITLWGSSTLRCHSLPAILDIYLVGCESFVIERSLPLLKYDSPRITYRFRQCTLWILIRHDLKAIVFGCFWPLICWIQMDKWFVQYRHSAFYFGSFTYFNSFLVCFTVKQGLLEQNNIGNT